MKNLANCKPSEFLRQTNKIRRAAEKWLKITEIMEIRKTLPDLPADVTAEERKAAIVKQGQENFSAILDAILEKHPDETLELLAMLCFIEPEDADNHPVSDYLDAVSEMIGNESVLGFFTSLMRLAQTNILQG